MFYKILKMDKNKEILLELFEEAKKQRIVLNQAEFAKAVGKSRSHLFKNMKEIPNDIIQKARDLLKTKNVSSETINKNAYAGEEIGKLIIQDLKFQAMYNIMMPAFVDISAKVQGKEFSQVYKGLVRAIDEEFENLKRELKEQELS